MANKALRLPVSELRKEGASNRALFCLPVGGRDVLLSMADRLLWDIYQENDGTRVVLSDSERAIVESTIEGLLMSCDFDFEDIKDGLQAIADALENLPQASFTCSPDITVNCGTGDNFIVIPGPGQPPIINPGPLPDDPLDPDNPFPIPDDWPTEPLDPETDPPPFGESWAEYDQDACAAANAIWNAEYQCCRILQEQLTETTVTLALLVIAINAVAVGGIALLFSREFIITLARSAWRLVSAAGLELVEDFFGEIADLLLENKQQMICFLYRARRGGNSDINDYISLTWNFALGTALYIAEPDMVQGWMRLLFSEGKLQILLAAGQSYSVPNPLDCSGCEEGLDLFWDYDTKGAAVYPQFTDNGASGFVVSGLLRRHSDTNIGFNVYADEQQSGLMAVSFDVIFTTNNQALKLYFGVNGPVLSTGNFIGSVLVKVANSATIIDTDITEIVSNSLIEDLEILCDKFSYKPADISVSLTIENLQRYYV